MVAVVVMLGVAGFMWGGKRWADDKFRTVAALDPDSPAILDAPKQAGAENFLLVGSDSRPGVEVEAQETGATTTGNPAHADTLMVVHVPADHGRVVVLSFPRDLEIERPACEAWDPASGEYGAHDQGESGAKINTAYQRGGPKCATRTIQQLTGLNINHYVGLDFAGFRSVVDAIGGIRLCVAQPVADSYLGTVAPRAGTVDLDGAKALDFVRASHVTGDPTSDYGRIHRQQRLLAAVVREALSARVLKDPGKLGAVAEALAAATVTDNVDVDDLVTLGRALDGVDAGKVTFVTAPTTGMTTGNGNEQLRADDAKALFNALIHGGPLPNETAPGSDQSQTGPPPPITIPANQVKLQVLNGTGKERLASQTADKLRDAGFEVVKVDNTAAAPATIVRHSASREQQARTVAAAVPGATLEVDPAMGGAVEIVLGQGFDGMIRPVEVGQSAPGAGQPAPTQPIVILDTLSGADTSCA